MALTLADLRSLFYVYLGTATTDPMYPTSVVDTLINAVSRKYIVDIHQGAPGYLSKTTTLAADADHVYSLPSDFAELLELRFTDYQGILLHECRPEELDAANTVFAYTLTGPDQAATLTTSPGVPPTQALYCRYTYEPSDLASASDSPSWMPSRFHDLLAREAAIDAFGVGAEAQAAPRFIDETNDRRAQFWLSVMKRSNEPFVTRSPVLL